jgi:hypothetical protein
MGFLIFGLFRLMWLTAVLAFWCAWLVIALPVMLMALATGNDHVAKQWQRSLLWRLFL